MAFSKILPAHGACADERPKTNVIPGDLVLYRNTRLTGNVEVHGDVLGYKNRLYNLTIYDGDLTARDVELRNLELSGNIRARSADLQDVRCNNVSIVMELSGRVVSAEHISAEEIVAKKVLAKGDISAGYLLSLTSIEAADLLVGSAFSAKDMRIRNAEAKDSIIVERDLYYDLVCHARNRVQYRHAYPQVKGARMPFVSEEEINIKSDIYKEKRD